MSGIKNLKLLMVDDDELFQRIIQMNFSVYNQFRFAKNLTEAEKLLKNEVPDIVLLDLNLKNERGLSLLPLLKKNYPSTIVIILTGESDFFMSVNALEMGADDYIVKGEHVVADLQIRLSVAVKQREKQKSLEHQFPNLLPTHKNEISKHKFIDFVGRAEKMYIIAALDICNGNVTETAEHLGISRATLFNKMNSLSIERLRSEQV